MLMANLIGEPPVPSPVITTNNLIGQVQMPLSQLGLTPILNPVVYKFRIPQLADYFEGLSMEQCHVALEGALNIIFANPIPDQSGLALQGDLLQSEEEDLLDHEQTVITEVAYQLYLYQLAHNTGVEEVGEFIQFVSPEDDYENSEIYVFMETNFRTILNKLAAEIAEDTFNQDIVTLYDEMSFFNRIQLYTHNYDTKSEILYISLIATM